MVKELSSILEIAKTVGTVLITVIIIAGIFTYALKLIEIWEKIKEGKAYNLIAEEEVLLIQKHEQDMEYRKKEYALYMKTQQTIAEEEEKRTEYIKKIYETIEKANKPQAPVLKTAEKPVQAAQTLRTSGTTATTLNSNTSTIKKSPWKN